MSDHLHAWLVEDCGMDPDIIDQLRIYLGYKTDMCVALHAILGPADAWPYIDAVWRSAPPAA